jgi:integrase
VPKLTADLIESTPLPVAGSTAVWDTGHRDAVRGFGIRFYAPTKLNPGGVRSFFVSYTAAGFKKRVSIGAYPLWSVTAARAAAKELRRRIDLGEDPADARRAARNAPTVQDLIDRYVRDRLPGETAGPGGKRSRDAHRVLVEIGRLLGARRRVAEIHYGDIAHLHETVTAERGPVRANRILAVCSAMFGLALKPLAGEAKPWRDQAQGNPCRGVPRNPEHGRERFYSTAELAAISDALAIYAGGESSAADCIRFITLTGCRPAEAMQATWAEFDAEPGFWVRPSAHVKQRRTHKVPLNPGALELIDRRRRGSGISPFVFPGNPATEPLRDISRCWDWVRRQSGVDGRIYDLRHTFASIGAGGGLSLLVIGRLLGHTEAKTTLRYSHLADDPLREATGRIGAVITGAGKPAAEVVKLRKNTDRS